MFGCLSQKRREKTPPSHTAGAGVRDQVLEELMAREGGWGMDPGWGSGSGTLVKGQLSACLPSGWGQKALSRCCGLVRAPPRPDWGSWPQRGRPPSTCQSSQELDGRRGRSGTRFKAWMGFGLLAALKLSHSRACDLRAQCPFPKTQPEQGQWSGDSRPFLGPVESGGTSGALGAGSQEWPDP